jgi:hypothetical protein
MYLLRKNFQEQIRIKISYIEMNIYNLYIYKINALYELFG